VPAQAAAVPAHGQPQVPQPEVDMTEEEDKRLASKSWTLFFGGLCCLCVMPVCGFPLLAAAAALYYCKPREQRQLRQRQKKPARAALITLSVFGIPGLFALGQYSHIHGPHHHRHHPGHNDTDTADVMMLGAAEPHHGQHHKHDGEHPHHGCHKGEHHHHDHAGEHSKSGPFSLFHLRGHWHHEHHHDGEDAQKKPCMIHTFLKRFFAEESTATLAPPTDLIEVTMSKDTQKKPCMIRAFLKRFFAKESTATLAPPTDLIEVTMSKEGQLMLSKTAVMPQTVEGTAQLVVE